MPSSDGLSYMCLKCPYLLGFNNINALIRHSFDTHTVHPLECRLCIFDRTPRRFQTHNQLIQHTCEEHIMPAGGVGDHVTVRVNVTMPAVMVGSRPPKSVMQIVQQRNGKIQSSNIENHPGNGQSQPGNGDNQPLNGHNQQMNGQTQPVNVQIQHVNGQNEPIHVQNQSINRESQSINRESQSRNKQNQSIEIQVQPISGQQQAGSGQNHQLNSAIQQKKSF